VLRAIKQAQPLTEVIVMTAYGAIESAVEAMKLGAFDYIQKPFSEQELLVRTNKAIETRRLHGQVQMFAREFKERYHFENIVGRSQAIRDVLTRVVKIAPTDATVLITGETGTGKELVARAIHARSAQRDMPLIKVNCAAIPETLLESELFGHVRGAFTGAVFTKKGRFALADGGTIFLDEIGTLGLSVQAKLLRVLQDREFEPLGSERTQRVSLRIIAATNRDLRHLVGEGKFQEDLFYRLNVIPIAMPPLRERREDIRPLAAHFVVRFAQRTGKRIDGIDEATMAELERYDWPGNVRELENTIERAVVLAAGPRLTRQSVWMMGATSVASAGLPSLRLHQNLDWTERETIRRALDQASGVKKDAAELMGISQRALSHYLQKHRLD
jgi:DNA-binding NtrC family response regulator